MFSDTELESLLLDLESDRVERQQSLSDADRIRQALCAFANDMPGHQKPGVLFVGATDSGECASLAITDRLLQTLADMRSDGNILPLPALTVQKRTLRGGAMAVVIVQPADAPPVRFKGQIWTCVGPRRAIAAAQEESVLAERRRYGDAPFDIQPVREASVEDLDQHLFQQTYLPSAVHASVIAENNRSLEAQMASLRLLDSGPPPKPTVLGLLTVGRQPTRFLPMAYVSFLRLAGEQLAAEVITAHDLHGPLPQLIPQLDELLRLHIMTKVDITSADTERQQPDYPLAALQQIIRNAVLHRSYEGTHAPVRIYWYTDRIEVISPGGPYGQVTAENFGQPGINDYRNPHLAEAMRCLGYVQHFGVGIQIAREALSRNGNPPPDFQVSSRTVSATIQAGARSRK